MGFAKKHLDNFSIFIPFVFEMEPVLIDNKS